MLTIKICECLQYTLSKLPKMEKKFLTSSDLLQLSLLSVGKGNANGQAIRDEILEIMHRHKVKETNDHFYEQWLNYMISLLNINLGIKNYTTTQLQTTLGFAKQ